jgi:hypothetical protein
MNDQRSRDDDAPETDSERRTTNLILLAIVIAVVGGGLWLSNAMLDARRADECMGRRNCNPISVPPQSQR